MTQCVTCNGRCRLTTTGEPMSRLDVIEDLTLAQTRWRKALREGMYFRAMKWAQFRDLALDHLSVPAQLFNREDQP